MPNEPNVEPRMEPPASALTALLLIAGAPTFGVLAAMYIWPGTLLGKIVFFACIAWLLGLPLFWHRIVDGRRWTLSPARKGGFGVGAFLGLAISVVIVVTFLVIGRQQIDPAVMTAEAEQNGIGTWPMYLAFSAYLILVNSVLEEYVYRWFIFSKCEVLLPGWLAVLVAAGIFTVHHVFALMEQVPPLITAIGSVGVFIGGAIWSWMYLKYRSVWPGYLSHAIVDVAILAIGAYVIFGRGSGAAG
jgi:membrane protease YdiL (CAAX protease family)